MAPLDRHGRVLPERPAAHLDRLVRAAFAALVSRGDSRSPRLLWNSSSSGCCFFRGAGASCCFFIVTPWQIGVILTANYTFLNYLVLSLGFCFSTIASLERSCPAKWKTASVERTASNRHGRAAPTDRQIPAQRAQTGRDSLARWQAQRRCNRAITIA